MLDTPNDDFLEYSDSTGSNASLDQSRDSAEQVLYDAENTPLVLAKALLQTHPEYDANVAKWEKYSDCYSANDIYRFIHKHVRESQDSYNLRIKRGYYLNYCASVIDLYVAYLFHAPITRNLSSDGKLFESFYKDADLAGTTFFLAMQDMCRRANIFGRCGVLVDMPRVDGIETEADRVAADVRPYLTLFDPTQILDWEKDRHGKYKWVKLEICGESERDWKGSPAANVRTILIWDRSSWQKWEVTDEKEALLVDEDVHDLGEVPFVDVRNTHGRCTESSIRDISDINLAILNWSSFGDEEIANRCLNILTMGKDSSGEAAATISHHNILEYAEGAPAPAYLTPGDTPLKMIIEWINRAKDEIYRIAKLGGSTGLLGVREATSGIAYAYEFNETNQTLASKAESLQQAEIEIHRIFLLWFGKKFEGSITYPKEFGVDDFLMELQILMQSRTTLTSTTAIKQIEKNLSDKLFAREAMSFREKVHSEIDSAEAQPMLGVAEGFGNVPSQMTKPQSPESDEEDEASDE